MKTDIAVNPRTREQMLITRYEESDFAVGAIFYGRIKTADGWKKRRKKPTRYGKVLIPVVSPCVTIATVVRDFV